MPDVLWYPAQVAFAFAAERRAGMWLLMKLLKAPPQTPHGGDNLGLGKADGR
jgi:hypothetical protein